MPTTTSGTQSLLPPTQQSPGNVRPAAQQFKVGTATASQDSSLWSKLGDALQSVQSQLDIHQTALQSPILTPDPIQVVSPTGALIAVIGDMVDPSNNQAYQGIWANNLYIGGTGPASAEIVVIPSGITINNATITETDGAGNTIVISPTPSIVATDSSGEVLTLQPAALGIAGNGTAGHKNSLSLNTAIVGMKNANGNAVFVLECVNAANAGVITLANDPADPTIITATLDTTGAGANVLTVVGGNIQVNAASGSGLGKSIVGISANNGFAEWLNSGGTAAVTIDTGAGLALTVAGAGIGVVGAGISISGGNSYSANGNTGIVSTTIVTAKLTGGGTNGSITISGGIITAYVPAT